MLGAHAYNVLIVSSTVKFQDSLMQIFPATEDLSFCTVTNCSAARRELSDRHYDFVIVNTPLPDEFGTRFAMDATAHPGTVLLMLVRGESYEEINDRVSEAGVFTLAKPVSAQSLTLALRWMAAARERLRRLEKKASTVEEKMEEIRLVNRAKWLLIEQLKMTEPEAHRYIEKQAMDRCTSKKDIAFGIIKTYM